MYSARTVLFFYFALVTFYQDQKKNVEELRGVRKMVAKEGEGAKYRNCSVHYDLVHKSVAEKRNSRRINK